MPFSKTKEILVFDETWCPIGTCVQITQIDKWRYAGSGCLEKPITGIVKGYKCGDTVMVVHYNGLIKEININSVGNKYEIRRLVPELDDTMDMDYESLMIEHEGSS